jgi:hypothetical protein
MATKTPMILMALVVHSLEGCAGPPSGRAEGGMDGAGSLGLGLSWDSGIFLQGGWEDGLSTYVVLNDRDEEVALTFSECGDQTVRQGCAFGATIATWHLPRRSMKKIAGADALAIWGAEWMVGGVANGKRLGLLRPDAAPIASEHAVVSNAGINSSSGGGDSLGQVETDFLVAPDPAFTLHLSLPVAGVLTLASRTDPAHGLPFLDVMGARSADATVSVTDSGLSVQVGSASTDSPVRVAVDVQYPEGFAGKLVGFDALFCVEEDPSGQCQKVGRIQRAIPTESPLP